MTQTRFGELEPGEYKFVEGGQTVVVNVTKVGWTESLMEEPNADN